MKRDDEGRVYQALRAELDTLPDDLAQSASAMAALELARSIDQGPDAYRFQAALVREMRETIDALRARAPQKAEGDAVDDLSTRRADRRRAAASNQ